MAVRRVEFPSCWFGWPSHARVAWCEWARRMGFDPNLVAVPGAVEADDDARTVTAVCHVPTKDGRGILMDPDDPTRAKRVDVVIQLESPALPMPPVYA